MPSLCDLWLPVLLSGAAVFVVSSIVHMATKLHRNDWQPLPDEEAVRAALRSARVQPGQYAFPRCGSMKDMQSPEMIAKYEQGPNGWLTVLPAGIPRIGRSLLLWFLYSLLVGVIVAYVASMSLSKGEEWTAVFRLTSTVALAGYAIGVLNDTIWKAQRWGVTLRFVFDGVLYALATGAIFASLWPAP
jgi:hypothetical protein